MNYTNELNNSLYTKPLLNMFENEDIHIFMYDPEVKTISIVNHYRHDRKTHSRIFSELQLITKKLIELNCDYSIDEKGNIVLN